MSARIAVVEKTFQVLEAMSDFGHAVTLKELTEATGLPKATLFRILQTLAQCGYVDQDQARSRYALTLRLFHLGRADSFEDAKALALPLMEALHARFNETVNLGILQGAHIVYAHCIETSQSLRWQVRPGARDPFYSTALGRAIAAFLPERQQARLLDRVEVVGRTPFTPASRAEVIEVLRKVARTGWALDDQETDIGVVCYGVPLIDNGLPVGAISLSIPKSRLTPALDREIVAAMLDIRDGRQPGAAEPRARRVS